MRQGETRNNIEGRSSVNGYQVKNHQHLSDRAQTMPHPAVVECRESAGANVAVADDGRNSRPSALRESGYRPVH